MDPRNREIAVFEPNFGDCLKETHVAENIHRYELKCSLTSAGINTEDMLGIETLENTDAQSNVLPWKENIATYLLLDDEKWGKFFITSTLSGCDVWVADDESGYDPLIVHINYNLNDIAVPNLTEKQNRAMSVLDYFKRETGYDYRYIACVSYDWASEGKYVDEIKEYWNTFTQETRIPYTLYNPAHALFFGTFASGEWTFAVKNLESGKI